MAAAWIDMALGDVLREYFRTIPNHSEELVERLVYEEDLQARLGTLSARTLAARVLNLISHETFEAVNELRNLRNYFAHKPFNAELTEDAVSFVSGKLDARFQESIRDALLSYESAKSSPLWGSQSYTRPRFLLMQTAWVLFREIAEVIEKHWKQRYSFGTYYS